ncbi:TPA: FimV/HubP family polar landmark protein [Legionella bozemanae]
MKKTVLFSSLFSLALPLGAYALGLGEMKVESALNQPFLAEIELIDGYEVSLSNIKVELADPKSYQSLGIERSEAISILFLDVKKNKQGKFVVEVHSKKRMIEPYMQLIVDLTWPKGQIFKIYTVLLDPPGYKLANTTAQRSLIYQRKFTNYHHTTTASTKKPAEAGNLAQKKKAAYGPASSKENVWQIAQRYKTSEAILPQIVLAIVGANPDAFIDGNLNGLKVGARLKIPSDKKFLEVPADLATVEVMAHDKAWNEKTSINHVLAPPYITGQVSPATPVAYSQIPPASKFPSATTSMLNQNLPGFIMPSLIPSLEKQVSPEQRTLKAEISITTAAVDSLRESNALLTGQLSLLQEQNKKLQKQLDVRDKELQLTRKQIQTLMKERIAIAVQRSATNISNQTDDFWILLILLFVAGGGCIAVFYYFKQRDPRKKQSPTTTGSSTLIASSHPASTQPIMSSKEELIRKEPLEEVKSELKPGPGLSPESHSEFKSESGLNAEPELKARTELESDFTLVISSPIEKMNIESDVSFESTATDEEPLLEIIPAEEENESSFQTNEEQKSLKEKSDNLLEFESGLHYLLTEKSATKENNAQEQISDEGNGLDFTLSVPADIEQTQKDDESKKLINLKNQKALDTLLALAKTYIGMEDTESALNSLNEVMEHGSKSQKEEAQRLIDAIHEKS